MSNQPNPTVTENAVMQPDTQPSARGSRKTLYICGFAGLVLLVLALMVASSFSEPKKTINVKDSSNGNSKQNSNDYDEAAAIANRSLGKAEGTPTTPPNVMAGIPDRPAGADTKKPDGFPEVPPVTPPPPTEQAVKTDSPVYEKAPTNPQTDQSGQGTNPPAATTASGPNTAKPVSANGSGRSNYYYNYYRVGEEEKPVATVTTAPPVPVSTTPVSAELKKQPVIKPPFGTQIPVRTLGVTYSFRNNSFVRMEVMREVKGEGWSIPRGAQLIGRLQNSVRDRVYVQSIGYIDPRTNRLVRFGGEVLGRDGGTGLQGERKRLDSRVGFVLNRILNTATQLGNSFLLGRRGSGGVLIPPFSANETAGAFNQEAQNQTPQFYVRVNGGTTGYLMVTDLPPAEDAEDAERIEGGARPGRGDFTQADLDLLLTANDPEEIRAMLSQLPPALRAEIERQLNQPK